MDLSDPTLSPDSPGEPSAGTTWIEPVPYRWILPARGNPADVALARESVQLARESVQLAFVAVLQHLPSRQRAFCCFERCAG